MVFAGYGEKPDPNNEGLGEDNLFRVAGTLGIGLRRYNETMGFKEGPVVQIDGQDIYFRAQDRLIPNEAAFAIRSIRWGVSAGKPVEFVVSDSVDKLQADPRFAGYDLFGAISKGVTNWNSVFGFDALKVRKGTRTTTSVRTIRTSSSSTATRTSARPSPTGAATRIPARSRRERLLQPDLRRDRRHHLRRRSADAAQAGHGRQAQAVAAQLGLDWRSEDDRQLHAVGADHKGSRPERGETERLVPRPRDGAAFLTKKQKVEQYITHTILHEIGHTLGLRHNLGLAEVQRRHEDLHLVGHGVRG